MVQCSKILPFVTQAKQICYILTCSQKSCLPVQPDVSSPVLQYGVCRHKLLAHIPLVCEVDLPVNPETQSTSVTTDANAVSQCE